MQTQVAFSWDTFWSVMGDSKTSGVLLLIALSLWLFTSGSKK